MPSSVNQPESFDRREPVDGVAYDDRRERADGTTSDDDRPQAAGFGGGVDERHLTTAAEASPQVELNKGFVEQQGPGAAQELARIVESLGAQYGDDVEAIKTALGERVSQAGIAMGEVELDRYAERIARGQTVDVDAVSPMTDAPTRD